MTCKQCKYIDRCMSEASFLGQVFDPDYDGEHSCQEFDTFTNADHIRSMSDEELALFMTAKDADECILRVRLQGGNPTATQIKELQERQYVIWLRWLRQPAGVE